MTQNLRAISWNVHYPRFAEDNGYVVETLEKLGPFDVICLQEYVDGGDDKLLKWLQANNYDVTYLPFAHNLENKSQGVMTAIQKNLKAEVKPVVLRKDGPRRHRPFPNIRGLIKASFKINDQEVAIMNFHSTYARPHVIDMRKREFDMLKKLLASESKNNPWFLCGDFNFIGIDRRRNYLKKRFQSFTGGLLAKTWRHHHKHTPIRSNLDYLFWYGDDLVIDAHLASFSDSDHRPLLADIRLTSLKK